MLLMMRAEAEFQRGRGICLVQMVRLGLTEATP
jgi:hypothetical protein